MLSVILKAVNFDLELLLVIPSSFLPVPGSVALHKDELWCYGSGGAAADRSQASRSNV